MSSDATEQRLTSEVIEGLRAILHEACGLSTKKSDRSYTEMHLMVDRLCDRGLASLSETQVPAMWRREWDGDVSDLGTWIYADTAEQRDEPLERWQPLYETPQAAPPPMSKEDWEASIARMQDAIRGPAPVSARAVSIEAMSKKDMEYLSRLAKRANLLRERLADTQLADTQEITKELHALDWGIARLARTA